MFRYIVLSIALALSVGASAQFGQMDALMHFQPLPLNPPPWPQAYGGELLIFPINGGASEEYITVGTTVEPSTGNTHPVLVTMDVGFGPSVLKRIDLPGAISFSGTAVCRRNNGDIFLGAVFYHAGNNTLYKYLIKTDATGAAQWCMFLGEGNIRELLYNDYDDRVLVYGEQDEQVYLGSFNPNTGAQDWAYTYTGNPSAPRYRAGDLLIDPVDEHILLMSTEFTNGTIQNPFVLKLDRLTGNPLWARTYRASADVRIAGACYHNGTVSMAGSYKKDHVMTMNIDPSNGAFNWGTVHRSQGKLFTVSDIDYNAGSDRLFVVGGVKSSGGYSDGFVMPVSTLGGNLIDFTAYSTAYFQGPFPYQADYSFNDIDVDFYSVNSDYEMLLSGTGANNGTSSYNGGMWTVRTDMWGENTQACPQDILYSTGNLSFNIGDGYYQYDGPTAFQLSFTTSDVIHSPEYNCNYTNKQDEKSTLSFDDEEAVLIYPNPASDWVSVVVDGYDTQVTITDAQGRAVLVDQLTENGTKRLNVSELSTGLYLIHQTKNGQTKVHKVMVE